MSRSNPAARLHRILHDVAQRVSQGKKVRDVMSEVFGTRPDDDVAIRQSLIIVDSLFVMTERRLQEIKGVDLDRFTKHFPRTRKALQAASLDNPSPTLLQQPLNPAVLESLDLCAARVGETFDEAQLEAEELEELSQALDGLFAQAESGAFNPKLREVVLDIVEALRGALAQYRIRGIDGLEEALARSLGLLYLHYRWEPEASKEEAQPLLEVLLRVEAVVARVLTYGPALAEHLPPLLSS